MDNLTFLSVDTETSGLSLKDDRILQYGFAMFVRGVCAEVSTYDIKQEVVNNAVDVNCITDDRIANGHSPYDVALLLNMVLRKPPRRIVCYNASFDLNFIGAEFQRLGFGYDFSKVTIVDPLVIHRRFHPFQKARLKDACLRYNIQNISEHDAGSDARAAGELYVAMHGRYGQLRNVYSNDMLRGWHNTWSVGFQEWCTRKGIQFDPADFEWPYRKEYECWESPEVKLSLPLW